MVAFLACMEVLGSGYQVSHCKDFIFLLIFLSTYDSMHSSYYLVFVDLICCFLIDLES